MSTFSILNGGYKAAHGEPDEFTLELLHQMLDGFVTSVME
jgi:hypothetical protein